MRCPLVGSRRPWGIFARSLVGWISVLSSSTVTCTQTCIQFLDPSKKSGMVLRTYFTHFTKNPFNSSEIQPHENWQAAHTSSKMRFLALTIATLRALTHDSFSSGLTARNTRLGTCESTWYSSMNFYLPRFNQPDKKTLTKIFMQPHSYHLPSLSKSSRCCETKLCWCFVHVYLKYRRKTFYFKIPTDVENNVTQILWPLTDQTEGQTTQMLQIILDSLPS